MSKIYSKVCDAQFINNTAFIIPYILDDNCICITDCLRQVDVKFEVNAAYIKLYYKPKSKQQYFWLLGKARENASYFNNYQENVDGDVYTVLSFSVNKNLLWLVKMLYNIQYKDIDKSTIVAAIIFWKEHIHKIIEKEETRAARESSSGLFFQLFNFSIQFV